MGAEMRFVSNLNAIDCCQTTTNEKRIYFLTNSCKLQKNLGSSKIRSLKSALLGKIHALFQDVLSILSLSITVTSPMYHFLSLSFFLLVLAVIHETNVV